MTILKRLDDLEKYVSDFEDRLKEIENPSRCTALKHRNPENHIQSEITDIKNRIGIE